MNEEELKNLFRDTDQMKSNELARQRAKRAALETFDEVHADSNLKDTQGKITAARLTPDNKQKNRRKSMHAINKAWLTGGFATAAVLVLSVSIFPKLIRHDAHTPYAEVNTSQNVSDNTNESSVKSGQAKSDYSMPDSANTSNQKVEAEQWEGFSSVESRVVQPSGPASESVQKKRPVYGKRLQSVNQSGAVHESIVASSPSVDPDIAPMPPYYQDEGRDHFENVDQNPVKKVIDEPVSTFSIDVDTASYSFVRRMLNQGVLPQKDAVRLEEMVNYFTYDYAVPENRKIPFKTNIAVMDSPWKPGNKLIQIGIKGYDVIEQQPRSNLVFLLDVSGSMNSPDKLPLVKQSMEMLLSQLRPDDSVSIAVYAGAAGAVLEPTVVKEKQKILQALQRLSAGGSTAGAQGIKLAYQLAESSFIKDGVNRIILATDGDFNVGITNREELKGFVERKRESGIFLSVLGFGQGNYHDHLMQTLAQNGNGVAAYIDTLGEAQKVLIDEATSNLFPIAKDVKIQVEFNPATVSEYRLLGYETRMLKQEDFNNDAVDAGDIGAGHTVTAIYEITPTNADSGIFDQSRYQTSSSSSNKDILSNEFGQVKVRYKLPNETESNLITQVISTRNIDKDTTLSRESGFAAAIAGFAQLLKGGKYTDGWTLDDARELAQANKGEDPYGYRAEAVQLMRKAKVANAMR